ncbi:alkyl hydroperoxide reductase subunit AhpC [Aquibacillus albus]|uniref:Alkyl hydroperoxide reductase subunit AhpC n=1 Tax=Aquibacillus albus TaxID=1168171 RepID=A0ABS2MY73_9BACI|nr:alkyl hydroperoxide reductase subunit AhpC [Aquibacillus albus]
MDELDVQMFIISNDTPEEQLALYQALEEEFGESLPFISDPELQIAELFDVKNEDVGFFRGYGMLDTEGNVVFNTTNDHWGEEFDKTAKEIKEEYNKLIN